MARILIGTFPHTGHVSPFLPLVKALAGRGHDILWNTSGLLRERVEATGARLVPFKQARDFTDYDPQEFAPGQQLKGIASLKLALKHVFIDNAPLHMKDLAEITRSFQPDLILCDPAFIGASWFHQQTGIPLAIMNVLPMGLSSRDTAPNGPGLAPDASPIGRVRNRALQWMVEHMMFGDVMQHWNTTRRRIGLPPTGWFQDTATDCELYLQLTVPGFEYPRSDLIRHAHFIGIMPAPVPQNWVRPEWWSELSSGKPVIHVTQGTVANEHASLIGPTLEAFANEDVLVVVSTGGRAPGELGLKNVPANARISTFLSYPDFLPHVSAMVTNGGYGGTQIGLAHGIPMVVAGTTEDKLEVSARVAWSGAGINLRTDTPTVKQVYQAVQAVLKNPGYRERAKALQAEYARYDAVALGVELIERAAATGKPVLRADTAPVGIQPQQFSASRS